MSRCRGTTPHRAVIQFVEAIEKLPPSKVLILSMRGVPMGDISSAHAFEHLAHQQRTAGGRLLISGLQPQVRRKFERTGLVDALGEDAFFWSADHAILMTSNNSILDNTQLPTPPSGTPEDEAGSPASSLTPAPATTGSHAHALNDVQNRRPHVMWPQGDLSHQFSQVSKR